MNTLSNIINTVILLYNRQQVSVDELMGVLDVSDRTVFRYLDRLSKAGIPVYFDRRLGGYTVHDRKGARFPRILNSDFVFMVLALKALEQILPIDYREMLDDLKTRLLTNAQFPLSKMIEIDQVIGTIKEPLTADSAIDILIQAALLFETGVMIKKNGEGDGKGIVVDNPRLEFDNGWHITGIRNRKPVKIKRSDIIYAQLI